MRGIILEGDGAYYVSTIYGLYRDVVSTDSNQRYWEEVHTPYYVVWDEKKENLIKLYRYKQNVGNKLILQILIIDPDKEDWVDIDNYNGGLPFLPRELADKIIDSKVFPEEIRKECLEIDAGFTFNPMIEINSEKDLVALDYVSGGFHDACIKEYKDLGDDSIYIKFDGIWGCSLEIWMWRDLKYSLGAKAPGDYLEYWSDGTLLMKNGFIYLVDDDISDESEIGSNYCFFRARHMKYHIIPD